MSSWLKRDLTRHILRRSPRDMEAWFGGSFVDAGGNAQSNADWIWNPDLAAVAGTPLKCWKLSGETVLPMTRAEKDAVDAAALEASRDAAMTEIDTLEAVTRALALVILDEVNTLRAAAVPPLTPRTASQLRTAIRNKLGS